MLLGLLRWYTGSGSGSASSFGFGFGFGFTSAFGSCLGGGGGGGVFGRFFFISLI